MNIRIDKDAEKMGKSAALEVANQIKRAIADHGNCRILLSTGASQFEMLEELTKMPLEWKKITMFHLDEYVGLSMSHPASFRKYLMERFIDKVHINNYCFVDGEGDIQSNIQALTEEIRKAPIDIALVGIGENAHIAFNDPPADFDTQEAFIVVDLAEECKKQQMGEGWFASISDVPNQAISMTVYQIMQSRVIISVVPGQRKAEAIRATLETEGVTSSVPATILKTHPAWYLFMDEPAASLLTKG